MNKEKVIDYLKGLSETEFVDIFYKSVPQKKIKGEDIDDAYCITNSGYYPYDGAHETEFLALPKDWNGFNENSRKEAAFSGKCNRCQAIVACISTEAICPICANIVDCD